MHCLQINGFRSCCLTDFVWGICLCAHKVTDRNSLLHYSPNVSNDNDSLKIKRHSGDIFMSISDFSQKISGKETKIADLHGIRNIVWIITTNCYLICVLHVPHGQWGLGDKPPSLEFVSLHPFHIYHLSCKSPPLSHFSRTRPFIISLVKPTM